MADPSPGDLTDHEQRLQRTLPRPPPLQDVATFVEFYRRFWEESLDKLDDYLKELQKADPDAPKN